MIRVKGWAAIAALALPMPTPAIAQDASQSFDCNGPFGKFAGVSGPATLPVTISGEMLAVKIRHGSYIPSAGVSILSPDSKLGVTLELVANAWSGKDLTPQVYGAADSSLPINLGKVPRYEPVSFRVSLTASGKAVVTVAGKTTTFQAKPLQSAKVTLFCQTGQFKFSKVSISPSK